MLGYRHGRDCHSRVKVVLRIVKWPGHPPPVPIVAGETAVVLFNPSDEGQVMAKSIALVLEVAVAAECDCIVTYNKSNFSGVERFGIEILDAREFLESIGELS